MGGSGEVGTSRGWLLEEARVFSVGTAPVSREDLKKPCQRSVDVNLWQAIRCGRCRFLARGPMVIPGLHRLEVVIGIQ